MISELPQPETGNLSSFQLSQLGTTKDTPLRSNFEFIATRSKRFTTLFAIFSFISWWLRMAEIDWQGHAQINDEASLDVSPYAIHKESRNLLRFQEKIVSSGITGCRIESWHYIQVSSKKTWMWICIVNRKTLIQEESTSYPSNRFWGWGEKRNSFVIKNQYTFSTP